jgi:hypothetical protein
VAALRSLEVSIPLSEELFIFALEFWESSPCPPTVFFIAMQHPLKKKKGRPEFSLPLFVVRHCQMRNAYLSTN